MALVVVAGASLQCSMGTAPSALGVLPTNCTMAGGPPTATITDNVPLVNIMPFGMCNSPSNPTVAAATAAASGVLTPMPCVPVTSAPWTPGAPTVLIGNTPALDNNCKLMCAWAGVIQVSSPGETTVMVP